MKKKRDMSRIRHQSGKPGTNWLAVAVAVVSLAIQAGMAFRWGGQTDANMGTVEKTLEKHDSRLLAIEAANAQQNMAIASAQTADTDVIRRLASIEQKVDELNQRR